MDPIVSHSGTSRGRGPDAPGGPAGGYVFSAPRLSLASGAGFGRELARELAEGSSGQAGVASEQRLRWACTELESIIVLSLIRAMRSTVPKDSLIGGGFAGRVYEDMFNEELARIVSQSNSLGIADTIYDQLTDRGDRPRPRRI